MFQDSYKKKVWDGPVPEVGLELASVPPSVRPLAPAVTEILSAAIRHTPVNIADASREDDGDWFRLKSDELPDHQVFKRLRNNWKAIARGNQSSFALIYCGTGADRGIWLYHRKTVMKASYPPGCHQVSSLS